MSNTNDFSKCKVGDKLWCIQLGDCAVIEIKNTSFDYRLKLRNSNGREETYTFEGRRDLADVQQSIFFSNPNIIAPPEPIRLPDYKPGEWIAVWDYGHSGPFIRRFRSFAEEAVVLTIDSCSSISWDNHCALSELPEVLAKWGEK
jgi:hypothetical protein